MAHVLKSRKKSPKKSGKQRENVSCAAWPDEKWLGWLRLVSDASSVTVDMVNGDRVAGTTIVSYSPESVTVQDGLFPLELKRADVAFVRVTEFPR